MTRLFYTGGQARLLPCFIREQSEELVPQSILPYRLHHEEKRKRAKRQAPDEERP
jgi:hypothetical protein